MILGIVDLIKIRHSCFCASGIAYQPDWIPTSTPNSIVQWYIFRNLKGYNEAKWSLKDRSSYQIKLYQRLNIKIYQDERIKVFNFNFSGGSAPPRPPPQFIIIAQTYPRPHTPCRATHLFHSNQKLISNLNQ